MSDRELVTYPIAELEKLKNLEDGEKCGINWFESSSGIVTRMGDSYLLHVRQHGSQTTQGIYTKNEFRKIVEYRLTWR